MPKLPRCPVVHVHASAQAWKLHGAQVLDFTPEWDYTAGGSKLLLTGSVLPGARTEAHTRPLFIKFDQTEVCSGLATVPVAAAPRLQTEHHPSLAKPIKTFDVQSALLGRGDGVALLPV